MSDSRVITKDFEYFAAKSIEEAASMMSEYGSRARVIAGGTDLLVGIKLGRIQPECLINIKGAEGMDRLHESSDSFRIGAGCTFHQVEHSPFIRDHYGALYESARSISSVQIKNMGTIGGNVCNASPASDCAPSLLVLGACVRIKGAGRERKILLEDLFVGPGETTLAQDEILSEIELPILSQSTGSAFSKIGRVSADLAKINVAAFIKRNGDTCEECRIALGSVAPTPVRVKGAEGMMREEKFTEALMERVAQKASEEIFPITDVRSTEAYRREVSKVMTKKILATAWERAKYNLG